MSKIDVLMPAYNTANHMEEAIASILNQSFSDFRLVVLDDGSTDDTIGLVENLRKKDGRIVIENNSQNLGIPATRDKLLSLGTAPYLAWMDADDVAHPQRLKLQYDFMEANLHIGAVSCALRKMESGHIVVNPETPQEIKANLLLRDVVCNPGSFLRRSVVTSSGISYVGTGVPSATDFAYWVAFSRQSNISNLRVPLIKYRTHESQESTLHQQRQLESHYQIVEKQFKELDLHVDRSLLTLLKLKAGDMRTITQVRDIGELFYETLKNNLRYRLFDPDALRKTLAIAYRGQCRRAGDGGLIEFIKVFGCMEVFKGHRYGYDFVKDCVCYRP